MEKMIKTVAETQDWLMAECEAFMKQTGRDVLAPIAISEATVYQWLIDNAYIDVDMDIIPRPEPVGMRVSEWMEDGKKFSLEEIILPWHVQYKLFLIVKAFYKGDEDGEDVSESE